MRREVERRRRGEGGVQERGAQGEPAVADVPGRERDERGPAVQQAPRGAPCRGTSEERDARARVEEERLASRGDGQPREVEERGVREAVGDAVGQRGREGVGRVRRAEEGRVKMGRGNGGTGGRIAVVASSRLFPHLPRRVCQAREHQPVRGPEQAQREGLGGDGRGEAEERGREGRGQRGERQEERGEEEEGAEPDEAAVGVFLFCVD